MTFLVDGCQKETPSRTHGLFECLDELTEQSRLGITSAEMFIGYVSYSGWK